MAIKAMIAGCAGKELSREEAAFFKAERPWGFILFRRNVETPDQVRRLVDSLRATVGRADAPVLIDQEGGRVQRLGPPHWPKYPAGRAYGRMAGNDPLLRRELARLARASWRMISVRLESTWIACPCSTCRCRARMT